MTPKFTTPPTPSFPLHDHARHARERGRREEGGGKEERHGENEDQCLEIVEGEHEETLDLPEVDSSIRWDPGFVARFCMG
eukprot:762584-Hanusia_phi.AAC.2